MGTHKQKWEGWKLRLETVQTLLTCLAIVVGAIWFFYQRQSSAKAVCSHKLNLVKVDNGSSNLWWCNLEVKISNVGQIPLDLKQGILKITQIQPTPRDWDLGMTNDSTDPNDEHDVVVWKQLLYRDQPLRDYILPGEEDSKNFEFMLPTNVQTFRVYSYLSLGTNSDLGWSKISIFRVKDEQITKIETKEE